MYVVLPPGFLQKLGVGLLFAVLSPSQLLPAQVDVEPQREQLLNGLRVLIWQRSGDQDVLIKLRLHSGAAFDLAGKSGEMALLGDLFFPDPVTREYFTDEMQGRLNVVANYDSVTITMQGRAREFERIIEILRNAIVGTQITAENVAKAREGRIKIIKETSISTPMLADRAIALRLFGNFPYGQPYTGSVESLSRIDRSDLLLARDRFLNSNNATLAIIGGVPPNRVMRALRQLLGSWRKSEQIIPATFRQPEPPDPRTLIINAPTDQSAEVRLSARGTARSESDAAAANMLAAIGRKRWEKLVPELARNPVFVRNDSYLLPGSFVMGATVNSSEAARTLGAARSVLQSLISAPATAAEFELARNEVILAAAKETAKPEGLADAWLDIDTYKLPSLADQRAVLNRVSITDLQRTAMRLFRDMTVASVVVGNAEQLKAELEPHLKIELLGEIAPKSETKAAPQVRPTATPVPAIKPD